MYISIQEILSVGPLFGVSQFFEKKMTLEAIRNKLLSSEIIFHMSRNPSLCGITLCIAFSFFLKPYLVVRF